jgi:multicomponent Na+:H+ antiporter subunit D
VIACGIGLLSGPGLAAAGLYAVGHACAKSALFLVTGLLLNRHETLDEHELYGGGRGMRVAGATFLLGGLGLAGLPPLGTWAGKAAFGPALAHAHAEWLDVVVVAVSALTGGSVIRAGLRIFLGLGERPDPGPRTHEQPEGDVPQRSDAVRVVAPPVVLLLVAVAVAVVPGVSGAAAQAGATIADTPAYVAAVLHGRSPASATVTGEPFWHISSVGLGLLAAVLATTYAVSGLWPSRRPALLVAAMKPVYRGLRALHVVHRAHVGDYVSWVLVGVTVLGATLLFS